MAIQPTIQEITQALETFAPIPLQEEYDNCGLIFGTKSQAVNAALLTLDCTEEVLEEAIEKQCNLIIAHHPPVFKGIKKLNGQTYTERLLVKAIQHNIALYAMHTNADNVLWGVNNCMADKLGLDTENRQVLLPKKNTLRKLLTFCPVSHTEKVKDALFAAGAGNIGKYAECSFTSSGTGTFKAGKTAQPFSGKIGERHHEPEERIETVFPFYLQQHILSALLQAHPYQEVAYDIYALQNDCPGLGSGLIGKLSEKMLVMDFLQHVKKVFGCKSIRYSTYKQAVQTVALCGGSGSFLLNEALKKGADAFVTADVKYHQFFDAEEKILFADIGHFESEQFTPEIFYKILKEKFPNFVVHLSTRNTNPINYL